MKDKAKIIKTLPDNEIIETNENKKSKANFNLKEKLTYFFQYIAYHKVNDVKEMDPEYIEDYITYLNTQRDNLDKVALKLNVEANEKIKKVELEAENYIIMNQAQDKIDKIKSKVDKVNDKCEQAKAELDVINEIAIMNKKEELENIRAIEEEQTFENEMKAINNKLGNEVQKITTEEEMHVEEPTEQEKLIDEALAQPKEINEKNDPEVANQESVEETQEQTIEEKIEESIKEKSTNEPIEKQEQSIEEPALVPIEEDITPTMEVEPEVVNQEPVEETKVNPLEQNFNNFEETTKEIEQNCTDDLSKKISEIFVLVKNEAKELVAKQLSEMSNTAKEAIINANQHTLDAKNELAIVEKDRDQYRSHYEQTVEVVKQKDGIITLRDDEITLLRSQLEDKNNELNAANERENNLNEENNAKAKEIELLKGKVKDLNIAIRTIVGQALEPSEKAENLDDSVQPIDLGETVEQEESTKTL